MPIRYEAPQPFAPSISQGAGRAEVETRNNAAIYGAGSDTARMAVAGAERQADRAERAADRRGRDAQAGLALAQRQTESDYGNAQRALLADAEIENRQSEFERQHQLQLGQAQMEERVRLNEIAARGQVQAMLQQQDLTLQEQQRLARLQTQLAYVANSNELGKTEKRDIMMEMMTGINPLKRRQEMALARQQESRAKLYEQQATLKATVDAKTAALHSKSVPERTNYILDPGIEAEVTRELEGKPITQEELAQWGQMAPRMRVVAAAAKRGGLIAAVLGTGFNAQSGEAMYQEFTPQKEKDDGAKLEAAAQKLDMDLLTKEADLQLKLADAKSKAAENGVSFDGTAIEGAIENIRQKRAELSSGKRPGGSPISGVAGQPEPEKQLPPDQWKPYDRRLADTQNRSQQAMVADSNRLRGEIANRSDLTVETRQRAELAVEAAADLMAYYGSYQRMPDAVKKNFDMYSAIIKALPEKPVARPAAPAARPMGQQPPRMRLWGGRPRS